MPNAPSPDEGTLRRYFRTRCRLLLFALLAWVAAVEFGPFHWFFDLGSHFRFHYALAAVVLGAALFFFKHLRLALIAVALLAWLAFRPPGIVEYTLTNKPQPAPAGTTTHSLISFNLHFKNTRFDEITAALLAEDPDFLLLLEATPAAGEGLQGLIPRYPHQLKKLRDHPFGIWFLSKFPLSGGRIVAPTNYKDETVVADIEPGGKRLRFVGAHPIPPMGRESWERQANQLQAYAALLAENPSAPRLLAGDLNTTPFAPHFKKLTRDVGLRDASLGCGLSPTWFPRNLRPGIAIDHVLVSDAISIHEHQIGPDLGSDHRWVKVVFSFKP